MEIEYETVRKIMETNIQLTENKNIFRIFWRYSEVSEFALILFFIALCMYFMVRYELIGMKTSWRQVAL